MDQLYNNEPQGYLWTLLADPSADKTLYTASLRQLISNYPQSGILHAILAAGYDSHENLKRASVYFNSQLLFKIINHPSDLATVTTEKIVTRWPAAPANVTAENEGNFFTPETVSENKVILSGQTANDESTSETDEIYFQPVTNNGETVLPAGEYELESNTEDSGQAPIESDELKTGSFLEKEFFIFGKSLNELKENIENLTASRLKSSVKEEVKDGTIDMAHENLTKYHDETLPYTFLWWLSKTRKEHAGVYQPYAKHGTVFVHNPNKEKINIDELQHQYFENIFHLTTVVDLEKNTAGKTVEFSTSRKENQIIERFIKEDPQIKPQQSDKLDNENKAKKSSEDDDEIVTETLAAIYAEQMLYHKAISSYKKLMLKFPEKSASFADKIEQLEKKINL